MSRRPPAGADRAAQNAQTLKALVKLEGNKVCADCKRNKHPRWASWNLGVFVCIRCSGIHRGMGTHISRVKSVDLDAWTDEQLQSVLKWGNVRANKYFEAKLAPGHVPSEAKIENFIRTKYESKRWVMDGPMPDPATLDVDDDVPLNIVQEKAKIERSASERVQETAQRPAPVQQKAPPIDLFGDISLTPPVRPNTADIPENKPTRTGPPPPPAKQALPQQRDSLLGLDFFGGSQGASIGRPSSAASNPTPQSNSRGDLKNSILSLYATAPKPQPTHERQSSFGNMTSSAAPKQNSFGGLADAFGGLNFSSTQAKPIETKSSPSAFSGLSGFSSTTVPKSPPTQSSPPAVAGMGSFPSIIPAKTTPLAPQVTSPPPPLSGGNFFDMAPAQPPAPQPATAAAPRKPSNDLNFAFTQKTPASPTTASASASAFKPVTSSIPADLFSADDFGGFASSTATSPPKPPAAAPVPATSPVPASSTTLNSPFNLSSMQSTAPVAPSQKPRAGPVAQNNNAMFDPWASASDSSPWGAPEPPSKPAPAPSVNLGQVPTRITPNDITGGWGAPISSATNKSTRQPSVTADEDFGGWTSASTTQTPATTAPPKASGGFGGATDPFDNPWG